MKNILQSIMDLTDDERQSIIDDAASESGKICCDHKMTKNGSTSEYWGSKQGHTEYTCQICGAFFIE